MRPRRLVWRAGRPLNLDVSCHSMGARALISTIVALAATACAAGPTLDSPIRPRDVFEGLAYWTYPGASETAVFSFHWYGDEVRVWDRSGGTLKSYSLVVARCRGLKEALSELLPEAARSAQMITGVVPAPQTDAVIIDPPSHRLVYYCERRLDRLDPQGFDEPLVLPWIETARTIRTLISHCHGS